MATAINLRTKGKTVYARLEAFLRGRDTRCIQQQKGRKGRVERTAKDTIGVKIYDTVVVSAHWKGGVTLNTGGWHTAGTRSFINPFLPKGFWVKRTQGLLYLHGPKGNPTPLIGPVSIRSNGRVEV